jgi:phosphoribosylformylglycinamidine cyclo-ligase
VKRVVKGLAHITGGGLVENLPRVLPEGCRADIEKGSWPVLPVFQFLEKEGALEEEEMFRVFNMGIGMVMIVSPFFADSIMGQLKKLGEKAYVIGEIRKGERSVRIK